MKDRLVQFLQLEQLSPARLSDILGVQRSGLSHILSGRNKPGFEFIQKILLKFPQINAEWLITGKGKMYKEQNQVNNTDTESKSELYSSHSQPHLFNNEIISPIKAENEPSQNSIKATTLTNPQEKRILKKMIMVYSDMTFEEYSPSEY